MSNQVYLNSSETYFNRERLTLGLTGNQAIALDTTTIVEWNSVDTTNDNLLLSEKLSIANGVITINEPGTYSFSYQVYFGTPQSDNSYRKAFITLNNLSIEYAGSMLSASNMPAQKKVLSGNLTKYFKKTDNVRVKAFTGVAQNLLGSADQECILEIVKL